MSLYNSIIPAFWQETYGTPWYGTPSSPTGSGSRTAASS